MGEIILIKEIANYKGYYASDDGIIYSDKSGELRELKPWVDSRGHYLIVGLSKNGVVDKKLVHRIIAETFIPNPNNYPEVNHLNYSTQDNRIENLEWCTGLQNKRHALKKYSPVRNYRECKLYYKGEYINDFKSICAAARYADENFGASYTGLIRNLKSKQAEIIKIDE